MKIIVLILILVGIFGLSVQFLNQNQRQLADSQESRQDLSPAPGNCSKTPLPSNIEGPYYKEGSPERGVIRDVSTVGTPLALSGYVYDTNCNPISRAWIDFWQTDGNGNYDNEGYKLRGHQYTDTNGKYYLTTVLPGEYPGRTPHLHVKIKAQENSPIITTQLYIPNVEKNKTDTLFNEALLINTKDSDNGIKANYDFIININ
jgi:protocatechuate 3,4-dioxygenase beta subunit